MTQIKTAQRIFKIGSLRLPDPDPGLPPDQAIQLYAVNYPQVTSGRLLEPVVEADGSLLYELERSPVKTKG